MNTTNELAIQLLESLGGNTSDIKSKYYSTTNDILDACKSQMQNNAFNTASVQIPIPQIHLGKNGYPAHQKNEHISTIVASRAEYSEFPPISLFWNGANADFLNYDPHYFLFKYIRKGQGRKQIGRKAIPSKRDHKTFVHPSCYDGTPEVAVLPSGETRPYQRLTPMFSNYGGGGCGNANSVIFGINDIKQTEWAVNPSPFVPTNLINLKANQYYRKHELQGSPFFPINESIGGLNVLNNFLSIPKVQRRANALQDVRYSLNLTFKFAIAIRNPNDPTKCILGGFSDDLIIKPTKGFFNTAGIEEPINATISYYKFSAMIK